MHFATIFLQLLFLAFLAYGVFRIGRLGGVMKGKAILLLMVIKLSAAYSNWAIYTHYYEDRATTDIYKYFDDGVQLYQYAKHSPFQVIHLLIENETADTKEILLKTQHWDRSENALFNGNRVMIKTHLILCFISQENIHFHIIFFSMISLIGCLLLLFFLMERQFTSRNALLFFLFLTPSFTFWNSAMLKESYTIFSIGLILFSYNKFLLDKKKKYIFILLLSITFLMIIKWYVGICLIPAILFLSLKDQKFRTKSSFIISQIPPLFIVSFYHKGILSTIRNKYNEFVTLGLSEKAESLASEKIYSNSIEFLQDMPHHLSNLLKPHLLDIHSVFDAFNAFENLFFTFTLIFIVWNWRRLLSQPINCFIILFCSYYLLSIAITVPIIGALVRYKSIILPFVFLIPFTNEFVRKKISFSRFSI